MVSAVAMNGRLDVQMGANQVAFQQMIIIIICGSFPAIRLVTGRRPRRFSLFMKIFRHLPFPFFFSLIHCFNCKHPLKRKEMISLKNG
ncbi:hypothetical protein D9F60_02820 [Escherichia coli]|nr:hypothetical protein [Escherichia coli]EFN5793361.1 hypothetical protein [Escherichia coli]KAA1990829.1 hypothetical protein EA213_16270 [Escherichia coli]MGJ51715.1 hypothetical protein [Escherichia coli]